MKLKCKCDGNQWGCPHGDPCGESTERNHPLFCTDCNEARIAGTLEWVAELKRKHES